MINEQIASALSLPNTRNDALEYLYHSDTVKDEVIINALIEISRQPTTINDTNSFASLLAEIGHEGLIQPLTATISKAVPEKSLWLADYLYALIELLDELENYYSVDDDLVHLLGKWLLTSKGGEISWKSSNVLAEVKNQATETYLLRGALDLSLLHLTRINCLRGVINHYQNKAPELLSTLIHDSDEKVKAAAMNARAFINQ